MGTARTFDGRHGRGNRHDADRSESRCWQTARAAATARADIADARATFNSSGDAAALRRSAHTRCCGQPAERRPPIDAGTSPSQTRSLRRCRRFESCPRYQHQQPQSFFASECLRAGVTSSRCRLRVPQSENQWERGDGSLWLPIVSVIRCCPGIISHQARPLQRQPRFRLLPASTRTRQTIGSGCIAGR